MGNGYMGIGMVPVNEASLTEEEESENSFLKGLKSEAFGQIGLTQLHPTGWSCRENNKWVGDRRSRRRPAEEELLQAVRGDIWLRRNILHFGLFGS